ncbi:MAG: type IV toxin-antitoxin system AbiEi family antitoxin [Saprospiraceae bacterium]
MKKKKDLPTYSNGATRLLPELRLLASKTGIIEKVYYLGETWLPVVSHAVADAKTQSEFSIPAAGTFYLLEHATRNARQYFRDKGISYITETGQTFLTGKAHTLLVELPETLQNRKSTLSGFTPATLKVAFVLLTNPESLTTDLRSISQDAGVGLGSTKRGIDFLVQQGFIATNSKKNRQYRWLERDRLIDVWAEEYANRLLPKMKSMRVALKGYLPVELPNGFQFGGAKSSNHYGGNLLSGDRNLIYSSETAQQAARQLRAVPDKEGKVEIRSAFWSVKDEPFAPVLVVYADMLAEGGRGIEEAKRIRPLI